MAPVNRMYDRARRSPANLMPGAVPALIASPCVCHITLSEMGKTGQGFQKCDYAISFPDKEGLDFIPAQVGKGPKPDGLCAAASYGAKRLLSVKLRSAMRIGAALSA